MVGRVTGIWCGSRDGAKFSGDFLRHDNERKGWRSNLVFLGVNSNDGDAIFHMV